MKMCHTETAGSAVVEEAAVVVEVVRRHWTMSGHMGRQATSVAVLAT